MNFEDIIKKSVMENFTSDIALGRICVVLGVTAALGIYVFFVYRIAVNNEFYSKDFNRTLVLMAVVTAGIVLAVQSNLVISLGMVGALSIVRYRTAIKSSLDLFFLFWAISIGIICGAGIHILAVVMSIMITIILFILGKLESPLSLGLLVLNCENLECAETAVKIVKDRSVFCRIKNKTIGRDMVEVILELKVNKNVNLEQELLGSACVRNFSFVSFDRENRI